MVRHDCPECAREVAATIRDTEDGEAYFCTGCGERVSASDVTTPDGSLTHRDHVALGKTSDPANPDPRLGGDVEEEEA